MESQYYYYHISPHCEMTTGSLGLLFGPVGTFSIFLIMRSPSMTFPNTTCFPSRKSHLAQVMKNWQPFVLGPLLAMERSPGPSCFRLKFSSANVGPQMLIVPVPSPFRKSPPNGQENPLIREWQKWTMYIYYQTYRHPSDVCISVVIPASQLGFQ